MSKHVFHYVGRLHVSIFIGHHQAIFEITCFKEGLMMTYDGRNK
jgi:hypothetical protein